MLYESFIMIHWLSRRANYELISILKKRGIFKDILLNGIGSQKIDLYLNKKSRSIYSILKLEDHRLTFSSLSTLFPLFIVQQLGHRPVLILDDREAMDRSSVVIEHTIHDVLRIFKNHVDHFLMPQYQQNKIIKLWEYFFLNLFEKWLFSRQAK